MIRRIFSIVIAVICLQLSTDLASANDAGCGLGSIVMQKNTKLSQTLAMTTNATLFTQLLGITFGTSGCSASGFARTKQDAVMYAEANLNLIKVDLARGEGEGLTALASLMGCSPTSTPILADRARTQYKSLFGNPKEPVQIVDALDALIKKDTTLSQSCTGLI